MLMFMLLIQFLVSQNVFAQDSSAQSVWTQATDPRGARGDLLWEPVGLMFYSVGADPRGARQFRGAEPRGSAPTE